MKRVLSACTYQTLSFILDPKFEELEARNKVQAEVLAYKEQAKDSIQILEIIENADGSVIMKVRKKVSGYPVGDYFN